MARKVIVVFIVVIRLIFGGVLMCAIEIKSMISNDSCDHTLMVRLLKAIERLTTNFTIQS